MNTYVTLLPEYKIQSNCLFLIRPFGHLIWLLPFICVLSVSGQGRDPSNLICATQNYSGYVDQQSHSIESDYHQFVSNQASTSRADMSLPLVIHIVHNGGPENITDDQVLVGIQHLNEAFANEAYYDQSTGVKVPITFCLATQAPNGVTTSGITRTVSSLTSMDMSQQDAALKSLSHWDATMYINVYLVREICMGPNCNVAGYANLPINHGSLTDGIVAEAIDFGRNYEDDAVIIHEMGHYLGLYHTFEGGCRNKDCLTQGDRVCDTPPDESVFSAPCLLPQNSCMSDEDDSSANNPFRPVLLGGLGDQLDMHINYMDYGDFACYSAFTQGQSDRMDFFTTTSRSSLLSSYACMEPCPLAVTANIVEQDMMINVGQTFTFHGDQSNAQSYYWTVNNTIESTLGELIFSFSLEGRYIIKFCAEREDQLCRTVCDEIIIDVICPVISLFSPSPNYCLPIDTTIAFTNNSINSSAATWWLNGIEIGSNNQVSLTFSQFGIYELILVATNQFCSDTFLHFVEVGCSEACFNGQDDDQDGYTDYYDSDCCCTNGNFNFICDGICYVPNTFDYQIGLEWESDQLASGGLNHPMIGDIDNDGQVEIVAVNYRVRPRYGISILNGSTGVVERVIFTDDTLATQITLADVDNDGFGEIIAQDINGFLLCFEHDGELKYKSNKSFFPQQTRIHRSNHVMASVADFNQDGLPEIYTGNHIYNGQTGELMMSDTLNSKGFGNKDAGFDFFQKHLTVAVDLLPDNYCSDCKGLELVAGNQIFSVDVANSKLEIASELNGKGDGFTNIVDYDRDGDLDVVVLRQDDPLLKIYIWDGQESIEIISNSIPMPVWIGGLILGNFDEDIELELAILVLSELMLFDHNLTIIWRKPLHETTANNLIAFDFNLDGRHEIITRDFDSLYIINSINGRTLYQEYSSSRTTIDNIAIADVDGDNSAEIIIAGSGAFSCFGVVSGPSWASARPVYNQVQYFNVNINDDLSVPIHQQSHQLVGDGRIMNTFGIQLAIPRPQFNGEVEITNIRCISDSINLEITVCNKGSINIPDSMPVSIYCGTPQFSTTKKLVTLKLNNDLAVKDCTILNVKIENTCGDLIFVLLNDDGLQSLPFNLESEFPVTNIIECDYLNNFDSSSSIEKVWTLDLGRDTLACEDVEIRLSAGNKFWSYLWSDTSRDSIFTTIQAGLYWVEVVDSCGNVLRDSLVIERPEMPRLNLGQDTTICRGGVISLNARRGFSQYQWNTWSVDSMITIFDQGQYIVTVSDNCGKVQVDSILVSLHPTSTVGLSDSMICAGDSIQLNLAFLTNLNWWPATDISCVNCPNPAFKPNTTTTYFLVAQDVMGCDVMDSMVISVGALIWYDTLNICNMDSLFFGNTWIFESGDYTINYMNMTACDSTVNYHIEVIYDTSFYDTLFLCAGDTIEYQNQIIFQEGNYIFPFLETDSCYGNYYVLVEESVLQFSSDTIVLCPNDSIFLDGQWIYSAEVLKAIYPGTAGCDSIVTTNVVLEELSYSRSPDTIIQKGDPINLWLKVDRNLISSLSWQPSNSVTCSSCFQASARPQETTSFQLTFLDNYGCMYQDFVRVEVLEQNHYFIPNAFSPNNDGINDRFFVYGPDNSQATYDIRVFNRWGGKVFEQQAVPINEAMVGWNGKQEAKDNLPGIYIYEIRLMSDEVEQVMLGDVLLMR